MSEPQRDRIGRYEILGELGHGAMGVVYKARDPNLDRVVAIKALRVDPGLPRDQYEELERRFSQEAIAAGRLNHPNIVAVHDVVEIDRIPYIVMECVEGRTLADLIASGELRLPVVIGLALQICSALDYAHGRGVVHRDIKPSNILVTEAGQVKVSDFGIARISGSKVTQTGAMLGTPAYMSPEQVCGREVDGRSDLFSLGLVLYEAISGRGAFKADDPTAVLYQIVHEEPTPIRDLVPSVSPALDRAILRVLAKQPDHRYATAGAFADVLRSTLEVDDRATIAMNGPRPPDGRPRRVKHPAMVLGGAALLVIVIGGGTVLWTHKPTMVSQTRETPSPPLSTASRGVSETPSQPATSTLGTGFTDGAQRSAEPSNAVPPSTSAGTQSTKSTKPEASSARRTGSSTTRAGGVAEKREQRADSVKSPEVAPSPAPEPSPSVPRTWPVVPREATTQAERPAVSPAPRQAEGPAVSPAPTPTERPTASLAPTATERPTASLAPTPTERPTASLAPPQVRPASPTPDEIKAQVVSLLRSSDNLSGVVVEVTPRLVVHLSGRVWDEDAQRLAVKLASSVKGVTEVTQTIVVAMKEMNEKFREAVQGGTIRRTP